MGASAERARHVRLVRSFMTMAPFFRLWLRVLFGVADWRDVEPQHHRVVLVDRVVAMHRVLPGEIAKAEEERGAGIRFQSEHVLAAGLDQRTRSRRATVDPPGLELHVAQV